MKKINYKIILLIILIVFISIIFSYKQTNAYKKELINNLAIITNKIIDEHPELEHEIINIINTNKSDKSYDILKKYGIDEDTIININNFNSFKTHIIIQNIIFTIFIIIIVLIIYFIKTSKYKKHKIKLEHYITNILNDDFNFNFNDYNESEESIDLNNIYKLTTKLKNQRDLYHKDKLMLEMFLSDISHQVKTPLTSLFLLNDALLNSKTPVKKRKEFLLKGNKELNKIEWLIISLLKLAKMENKTIQFKKEKCNLSNIINEIKDELSINTEIKNQIIEIDCKQNITVINDCNWLKEAIINVVKNAHEYGYKDSNIKISVKDNPIYTSITIINNGETINENELRNLFNRFYKGKNSKESSIGIGLNLTKNILENNNGTISISSLNNETKFIIKLFKNVK